MSKIITVHSFRQSVGKSTLTANMAAILARKGLRVCLLDTDFQGASAHLFFDLSKSQEHGTFNDFVLNNCSILDVVYDVTDQIVPKKPGGKLFLIPASSKINDVMQMLHTNLNIDQYNTGLGELANHLELDVLLVDTRAGLNENTMILIAVSNVLLLVLHPDQQDFQGTAVTVEIAKKLQVPKIELVLNDSAESLNSDEISKQLELTYHCGGGTVFSHNEDLMALGSSKLFVITHSDDIFNKNIQYLSTKLLS